MGERVSEGVRSTAARSAGGDVGGGRRRSGQRQKAGEEGARASQERERERSRRIGLAGGVRCAMQR
jgi:hypothetical protein